MQRQYFRFFWISFFLILSGCSEDITLNRISNNGLGSSLGSSSSSGSGITFSKNMWKLSSTDSSLHFSTTKKIHVVENITFDNLYGAIINNNEATLTIDLNSLNSAIDIRDQRMKNLLFETINFPLAEISVPIDMMVLDDVFIGDSIVLPVMANMHLHGVEGVIETELEIYRLTESRIMVKNLQPVVIDSEDYNLALGVESLRAISDLVSITNTVPVDFVLFYDAL